MDSRNKSIVGVTLIFIIIISSINIYSVLGKKPEHAISQGNKIEKDDPISSKKSEIPGQDKKNDQDPSTPNPPEITNTDPPETTTSSETEETTTENQTTEQENSTQTNSTETDQTYTSENQTITEEPPQNTQENGTLTQINLPPEPLNVYGINYHSIWWHYNDAEGTTNEVLHRDFSLFRTQGIQVITLLIQWSYMEPSKGYYRVSYIQDIQRVISIAAEYDIQCIVDFHTAGSFSMPGWTPRRLTDIVIDSETREAFLQMQRYVITELDGPNVHSFHLFNEPYLSKSSDPGSTWLGVTSDQALDFLQELYDNAKTVTSKPCSIRYGCDSIMQTSQFADDPLVWSSSDYITVNYYMAYHNEYYLRQIIEKAHTLGKKVMIGEFGYRDATYNNDELQRQKVAEHINLFNDAGLDYAMAWIWRADRVINDGSYAPVGEGYNMAANLDGDPRPSFYEIGKSNNPTTST